MPRAGCCSAAEATDGSLVSGNRTRKLVPAPNSLSTVTAPSWA